MEKNSRRNMFVKINRDEVIISVSFLIGFFLYVLFRISTGLSYPSIIFSTTILICSQAVVMRRFGMVSPASLFQLLMVFPGLTPFLAKYIIQVPNLTIKAIGYESSELIRRTLFFVAIFCSAFTAVLFTLNNMNTKRDGRKLIYFYPQTLSFIGISGVNLVSAYLTTPGPTILTASYATILNNSYSWASFAGSLYLGSWVVLYLVARESNSRYYRSFLLVTAIGAAWLLLHSRRIESLGVLVVTFMDWYYNVSESDNKMKIISIISFALLGIMSTLIGQIRSSTADIGDLLNIFIGMNGNTSYLRLPGSAHNVFGTFLVTVDLAGDEVSYLLGRSFLYYPIQAIPGVFYSVIGIQRIPLFESYRAMYPYYNGGAYFNVFYANFGMIGILVGAVTLGLVTWWAQRQLLSSRTNIKTGIAAVFVAGCFRAMWYTPLNWADFFLGFVVTVFLYIFLTNIERIMKSLLINESDVMNGV
ncbi:hypothetical protein EXE41_01235 [Halorubrum sp. SD690R]|uniref:hypothetical protein n=1 Tax=Halorubrum sp. SD690R TaxID=2518117 RepID=UPI0010F6B198|nr:hypothetical protein [Halorubrum sp. SD690R]TKX48530.1 hypothetical protein EXE41_01235 [Halorubrum sp. SD690R]